MPTGSPDLPLLTQWLVLKSALEHQTNIDNLPSYTHMAKDTTVPDQPTFSSFADHNALEI